MSYTPTEWESTDVVTATRLNALEQAVGDLNMSYTPNVWQNGDILTADKMNALEQAVASGGGGSSDFSTATVIVTSNQYDIQHMACPVCYEEDGIYEGSPAQIIGLYIAEPSTQTVTVPLYKGCCIWEVSHKIGRIVTITASGDIECEEGDIFAIITGDGTLNIVED